MGHRLRKLAPPRPDEPGGGIHATDDPPYSRSLYCAPLGKIIITAISAAESQNVMGRYFETTKLNCRNRMKER